MKKLLYTMVLLAGLFSACEEPGTSILYDKTFLELDAATTVTGSKTYTYKRVDDGAGVPSGFIVNLGSAQLSNAIDFTFEIDVNESTAIENLHYMVNGSTGTIAANSSTVELPITILDDNINPGEQFSIVVNLTTADVDINPNYQSGTHMIQITCDSDLAGDYAYTVTGTSTDPCCPNETTQTGTMTLTDEGDGVYTLSDWSAGLYFTWYEVYGITADFDLTARVTDICGNISGEFGEPFGTNTVVTGSVDPNTGVITYTWTNGYDDTATVTLTPQ